jgi:hypothetical protein
MSVTSRASRVALAIVGPGRRASQPRPAGRGAVGVSASARLGQTTQRLDEAREAGK